MHIPYIVSGENINDVKLVVLQIQHHASSHTCTTTIHNPILKECHNPAPP